MNTIIKQLLAFILSFSLIFATTARANANTSIGGWSAVDTITAGATNTINAAKTAGGKALKSAVTIAPQAGKVGKYLLRGGAAGALALAVPQILGDGVDWILDPANNRVIYKAPDTSAGDDITPADPYQWGYAGNYYKTADDACRAAFVGAPSGWVYVNASVNGDSADCNVIDPDGTAMINNIVFRVPNPAYDPSAPPSSGDTKDMYLPIADVAAQVISNAEAGHAPSQEAVKATALEGFAAGEHDAALDAAATETGTENPPDTENPPKDPDAPAEPFDPAGIISAINALKALLAGILSSITSLSDFFQSEPPPEPKPEDTEIDIPVPDVVPVDTDINFGGSCPANFEFNGSIFGNPINIVLLDTSKFCGFLSTFVKFPVYAASSLFALYILGGRKDV